MRAKYFRDLLGARSFESQLMGEGTSSDISKDGAKMRSLTKSMSWSNQKLVFELDLTNPTN